MTLTKEDFEVSAQCFMGHCHPDLFHKRLTVSSSGHFLQYSLYKRSMRLDVTIAWSPVFSVPEIFFVAYEGEKPVFDIYRIKCVLPEMETGGDGAYKSAIGIGQDPCDSLAAFFVHPCRVGQIIGEMHDLTIENYLITFWNLYKL